MVKDLLNKKLLFFDGAMGTQLQRRGLAAGEIPETYNFTKPDVIVDIHKSYLEAGADIIKTNTFGANELKLKNTAYSTEEVINKAAQLARQAIGEKQGKYIALDIGPTGQLLAPLGVLPFEQAYEVFKRQVQAGVKAGCDLILIETISDIYEAKAAVLAAKENSDLPVFCTMTFEENGRTFTGTDPLTMVMVLEGLGVDALGVNCSLGPEELMPVINEILKYSSLPLVIQPNAGLPKMQGDETVYNVTPEHFAVCMKNIALRGGTVFGGCCGTDDKFIYEMINALKNLKPVINNKKALTAASSGTKTVIIGEEVRVIGERINPTGKKKFKEALKNGDIDYILNEAVAQQEAGADILDVNVGLPEIDELKTMVNTIKELQAISALPLQIDSSSKEVLEAAARIYNGKPIVNSVNGKEQIMREIFPIVKKYGACVIGLTLDENGIPPSAEERVGIAGKIIETAGRYGIAKENIIIDCLVLTASAQQAEVMETIKAVRMVKERYQVKTCLGVSNVSFGLPNRGMLNQVYLAMALTEGLDIPIVNPNNQEIMDTVNAYKVLANQDKDAVNYIKTYSGQNQEKQQLVVSEKNLKDIVVFGLKEEAAQKVTELLKEITALQIVDDYLIPALDTVGEKYEKAEIFLPQLIQAAETVKKAFAIIKESMLQQKNATVSKGKIILATVKGDIHDIGKNIVKVLLENYGFEIIDLGKDVPIEKIVDVARQEKIELIGLSALMTTTVKNIEESIIELKRNNIACKVFVGGAVLNPEYAEMINADYYAKDAQAAVQIAKNYFIKGE